MVQGKNDEVLTYENSITGFGSLRIIKSADRLIYISDTNMEEAHW